MFAKAVHNPTEFVRFHVGATQVMREDKAPRNPYATGYGKRIPTVYKVRLWDNRWRRVYVACYSNSGTTYVESQGKRYIVEIKV